MYRGSPVEASVGTSPDDRGIAGRAAVVLEAIICHGGRGGYLVGTARSRERPAPRAVLADRGLLVLSAETEQWLRDGDTARVTSQAVVRDLGPSLAHGEPETGRGQGEAADAPAPDPDSAPATDGGREPMTGLVR